MARYLQRPENALKRANEFIDVGKPLRALDTLQEVFRNNRNKWTYTWSESVIEPIMFKYLDLCVELKKSHIAKEGLFQYRNMFQLVNVGSLENVIRGYLRKAEERTEAAQQQSSQAVIDIDDLDNFATPESILMSAVCGEDAQDRSDRTILLPWVKFLWESYCQCLELLRVNTHCEALYHDIARMAFQFCIKYNRKMEFRKLSEKLRKHLEDICKVTQTTGVTISKPETQQLNLDTRLHQLDSAIHMELWQEAYKAIEDINNLMTISKKTPVAKTMANYYQKMAMVFWKAGNHLFHASALLKLFQLTREMKKNITVEEVQRMASHVLVATLAIPLPSAHPEFDRFIETDKSPLEKVQRLANLLGIQQPPTRASLIKELTRLNVVGMAGEQFQQLYRWMEVDFDPLNLCARVKSVTSAVAADEANILNQYVIALHDVTLVRLIRQISQVYQTIQFERILALAEFTDTFRLERTLVDCVRHNDMQIRIDHQERCIHFGTDLAESQREDRTDGPALQSMPSEQIRSQLVNMSTVLHRAMAAIAPQHKRAEREKLRAQMVRSYEENKDREHQRVLQRQRIIEERKEFIERLNIEREEEEQRRAEELARQLKLSEQKRLELDAAERERKRTENEIAAIKEKSLKDKMLQIAQTAHGQKVLKKLDEKAIKALDADQIAAREAEELIRERKELQTKLKTQEKKHDYFERAKRLEEIPLIEEHLRAKQEQDREFWEKQEVARIEAAVAERANAVLQQERLARMHPDRDVFVAQLRTERNSLFVEKQREFAVRLEEERRRRLAARVQQRREERRREWHAEREAEAVRREQEARKAREEEERVERERRAKEREADADKLRAQAEKQRLKEEEQERKLLEEREAAQRARDAEKGPAAAAGGRGGAEREAAGGPGAWRSAGGEREQRGGGGGGERLRRGGDDDERQGDWRGSAKAAAPQAAAASSEAPRSAEPWRARNIGGERENAGDRGAWRSERDAGAERKPAFQRGGDRGDEQPLRRGGDRGDEQPLRRGGERPAGGDRDRDFQRGGGGGGGFGRRQDDGGAGGGGSWRRAGGEERGPMRRGGDREEQRGGDRGGERGGELRRGGDRDEHRAGGGGELRRGGGAGPAGGERGGERGGNWRRGGGADEEAKPKLDKENDDGGWKSVRRN